MQWQIGEHFWSGKIYTQIGSFTKQNKNHKILIENKSEKLATTGNVKGLEPPK